MRTYVLPDRDEMLRRLKGVINNPALEEGFYSLIAEKAGQGVTAYDLDAVVVEAIKTYTGYRTGDFRGEAYEDLWSKLYGFIRALLGEEAEQELREYDDEIAEAFGHEPARATDGARDAFVGPPYANS